MSQSDPELAAAVAEAMAPALDFLGPLLREAQAHSPLLDEAPTPDDIIERMKLNGLFGAE